MDFRQTTLRKSITSGRLSREIIFCREIDSTNQYAAALAQEGAREGTAVIADYQTSGKGQHHRVWCSPAGKNLYTSIVLRPPILPSVAPQLTLMTGVAVAEMLAIICPGAVTLKWPNDVLINKKKVCGILTEMRATVTKLDFIVVGIGININMDKEDFQGDFRYPPTSLKEETGIPVARVGIAAKLYASLEKWYATYLEEGFPPVREKWLSCSGLKGEEIIVTYKDKTKKGRLVGIDEDGALLLIDKSKHLQRILSGDVVLTGGEENAFSN